jgi:FkbM family methyltransferase
MWVQNAWQRRQEEFMKRCLLNPGVKIEGVIHVGAHLGEEYELYKRAGAKAIAFFEPQIAVFEQLTRNIGGKDGVLLFRQALGSRNEARQMHINRGSGESSSLLPPTSLYDGYFEEKSMTVDVVTLDSVLPRFQGTHNFNLLVTDTQGFDLEVMKGSVESLVRMRYVYAEVTLGHYHGEARIEEMDTFLAGLGFARAATDLYGSWKGEDRWGDLFYIKDGGEKVFFPIPG